MVNYTDRKEMQEADCVFFVDEPRIIYSVSSDSLMKDEKYRLCQGNLFWVTSVNDPEDVWGDE